MGQQVRYGRRRSHGAGALIAAVILVVAALIAAWTLLPRLFTPRETARTAEEAYCAAVSSDGARRTLTLISAERGADCEHRRHARTAGSRGDGGHRHGHAGVEADESGLRRLGFARPVPTAAQPRLGHGRSRCPT